MRKHLVTALIILLSLFLFNACKKDDVSNLENGGQDLTGFYLEDVIEGGGTVRNANLNFLSMKDVGADTVLTLDFVSDSKLSGTGTQTEVGNPPKYKVYALGKPYRLVIEFNALAYWDYERTFDPDSSELIQGVFNYSPEQGGTFRLYLQLSREVAYHASVDDSVITVTLRPIRQSEAAPTAMPTDDGAVDIFDEERAPAGTAFYVLANAYRDYCSGIITTDEMSPVLASNGENILMISEAFTTKNAADQLMESVLSREQNAVRANWTVITLADGLLPDYAQGMDYLAAYDVLPARENDAAVMLPVVIPDGLFLTMTPEDALLYTRHVSEYEAGGGVSEYELLFVQSPGGSSKQLLDFEFQTVESAKYSPDGRKLAVLERSGESAHLYVFDVDSRDLLTDLYSMGFGDTVSTYCWDSMGGRIFSIGGSNEIVVNQYDFNVPNESKRYTVVDRKGVDETSLSFIDGEVFFCETTIDNGAQMYRIKPEGGLRRLYLAADAFAFSDDDRFLAYTHNKNDYTLAQDASGSTEEAAVFAVMDLQTGNIVNIKTDFRVYSFKWSKDAKKIFYFENMLSGNTGEGGEGGAGSEGGAQTDNDPYPYRLWVYDMLNGRSSVVADLMATNIGISDSSDTVYICYVDPDTLGNVVRATYTLKIAQ